VLNVGKWDIFDHQGKHFQTSKVVTGLLNTTCWAVFAFCIFSRVSRTC